MSTPPKLISVLTFTNVPAASQATLPHGLTFGSQPVKPDLLLRDNADFSVVATTTTQVTVQNNGSAPATLNLWCEHKHSIPRVLGAIQNLNPQPFIPAAGAGGVVGVAGNSQAFRSTNAGSYTLAQLALPSIAEGATYAIDFSFLVEPPFGGGFQSYNFQIDDGTDPNVYVGFSDSSPTFVQTRAYGRALIRYGAVSGPNQDISASMDYFLFTGGTTLTPQIGGQVTFGQPLPVAPVLRVKLDIGVSTVSIMSGIAGISLLAPA
jgi:hypothetical protein